MSSISQLYDKVTLKPELNANNITPKMYKGFSTVNSESENFKLYDYKLIQQDLLNNFYTRQGERLMNPAYGTVIWDLLFEPMSEDLKFIISRNVSNILNNDPRVSATQIIVTSYETGIQVECILTYLPYNISQAMQLKFDQANGLLIG